MKQSVRKTKHFCNDEKPFVEELLKHNLYEQVSSYLCRICGNNGTKLLLEV